jgi:hypothetical protein
VRSNWAGLKTIAKAASGGSAESQTAGNITPGALSNALKSRQGPDMFSRTVGGMNDTARVAKYLTDTNPNSGTPATLGMQSMLYGGPGTITGAGIGGALGGPVGAGIGGLVGGGIGMAVPNVAARVLSGQGGPMTKVVHDYLINQALQGNPYLGVAAAVPQLPTPNYRPARLTR